MHPANVLIFGSIIIILKASSQLGMRQSVLAGHRALVSSYKEYVNALEHTFPHCTGRLSITPGDKLKASSLKLLYSRPSIIQTSLIRTLDYPNYQINDIHSICGVHQINLTSPPIENIVLHLSKYSVIRMT